MRFQFLRVSRKIKEKIKGNDKRVKRLVILGEYTSSPLLHDKIRACAIHLGEFDYKKGSRY